MNHTARFTHYARIARGTTPDKVERGQRGNSYFVCWTHAKWREWRRLMGRTDNRVHEGDHAAFDAWLASLPEATQ